jgi:hypothetical protein
MTTADVCRSVPPVDPRSLTRTMAIARMILGTGLAAAPQLVTGMWLGSDSFRPAATVLARAMGARDAVIGGGLLASLERGAPIRGWLTAGLAADATDLIATIAQRDQLPRTAVPVIVGSAGAGVALGVFALAASDS